MRACVKMNGVPVRGSLLGGDISTPAMLVLARQWWLSRYRLMARSWVALKWQRGRQYRHQEVASISMPLIVHEIIWRGR